MNTISKKLALRKELLSRRRAIPPEQLEQKSEAIAQHIYASQWFQSALVVFAYRSFRQEASLQWLYDQAIAHVWGLPRCVGKELVWHQWQRDSEFAAGRYGIEEPQSWWPALEQADLILVPTVACDRSGYRLGYGGGYYDRMLANIDPSSTRTIGVVLEAFMLDALPVDPWDQPLDAVCSESGLQDLTSPKG
ncbi:MAG: 5-formyltetrahydrofolate cyclo-ligase [Cyanobacteria bacterium P01_F01_bin.42]